MSGAKVKLVRMCGHDIFRQLYIEEALFRCSSENWFILNEGSSRCGIVMGTTNKVSKLLNLQLVEERKVPVMRRFTGGGTVYVNQNTLFSSFIFNNDAIPVDAYPRPIMQWTTDVYRQAFHASPAFDRGVTHVGKSSQGEVEVGEKSSQGEVEVGEKSSEGAEFELRGNIDYTIGDKKVGGNAQALARKRFVHHTSFLFDYDVRDFEVLAMPDSQPEYRQKRSHADFVTSLNCWFPTATSFGNAVEGVLREMYEVEEASVEEAEAFLQVEHRSTNSVLDVRSEEEKERVREEERRIKL
mmetsp:Transcript_49878/g.128344  ORF Transcript_49878/g.128344 Transcript_49878/m.128344 type:complete len:298 (-) Transcript_49878:236-1129(-)